MMHEDFLLKDSIDEGGFNVNGVSVDATGGHDSDNGTESAEFDDRGEAVGIVDAGALAEALGDETGFEAVDKAIGNKFYFKDPFVANGVTTKGKIGNAEGNFVMKGGKL
jgi:hypothetical protein